MDRLQTMRVFQAVADEGGFSAAARWLEMSVPTVTRLIADLEQHLGSRLFQRTTRKVVLTPVGEAYLQRVRPILNDVEEAFSLVQTQTHDVSGTVRVSAASACAEFVLAPLLPAFHAQYPHINVDLHVEQVEASAVGDYDLTFISANDSFDADVVARPIFYSAFVACASPDYLNQHGRPAVPQDLAQHQCLLWRYPGTRVGPIQFWRKGAGAMALNAPRLPSVPGLESVDMVEVVVQPLLAANHIGTLMRATLEGAGISLQHLSMAARLVGEGRLEHVLPEWTAGEVTLYATMPTRKFVPTRVRRFLDFVADEMAQRRLPNAGL